MSVCRHWKQCVSKLSSRDFNWENDADDREPVIVWKALDEKI